MASAAVFAQGTLLKIDDGVGNYTTIAEVLSITGPSIALQTIDVTNHDSTNKAREFIAGLIDAGSVTFDINYQPAAATHGNTTGLLFLLTSRVKRNFKVVFPDGGSTTWILPGFVTKFAPSEPVDAQLKASIEIKFTGMPTLV
jgi:predicted secreted protein